MGGEKETYSLPNLQVLLYLNTFEHNIKIVISHNKSHGSVARQFNIPLNRLDLVAIQSDLHQIIQICLQHVL